MFVSGLDLAKNFFHGNEGSKKYCTLYSFTVLTLHEHQHKTFIKHIFSAQVLKKI